MGMINYDYNTPHVILIIIILCFVNMTSTLYTSPETSTYKYYYRYY